MLSPILGEDYLHEWEKVTEDLYFKSFSFLHTNSYSLILSFVLIVLDSAKWSFTVPVM